MRPEKFRGSEVVELLRRRTIATMAELKDALVQAACCWAAATAVGAAKVMEVVGGGPRGCRGEVKLPKLLIVGVV